MHSSNKLLSILAGTGVPFTAVVGLKGGEGEEKGLEGSCAYFTKCK